MFEFTHHVWSEKYRPQIIDDCILPKNTKSTIKGFIESGQLPSLLLHGPAGTGKTSLSKAICNELDYDYLMINGSNEGRLIDTLRTTITQFASTVSFEGKRKAIIIDECLEENEKVRIGTIDNYTSIALKDLEYDKEYPVVSFNMETGILENDTGMIISDKDDEVFEVILSDDRMIYVNAKHPFIVKTIDGKFIQKSINDGLCETDEIVGV